MGTSICINQKEEIISVDLANEYPDRFINKDLESLLKCIGIFLAYENEINKADDDEIQHVLQEIRTKFDMIDIQALCSTENWWFIILEQIELGLM